MWDEITGATGAAGAVKYAAKGMAGAATGPQGVVFARSGGRCGHFSLWRRHGTHATLSLAGRDVRLRVLLRAAWR